MLPYSPVDRYQEPVATINRTVLFVVTGMSLLISVSAETGVCVPLPSKLTSASAAIPAYRPCLPSRCLAVDYFVTKLQSRRIK
jgi:hypothetical protein